MPRPRDPLLGRVLDRYRIVEVLGEGGMATVYLGRAEGLGGFRKWVAIKVMHADLAAQPQMASTLLDEARLAARIMHPNVVDVFDAGRASGVNWIAMEYLKGEVLRDVLVAGSDGRAKPLPVELAAYVAAEAAEGLHAAHELTDDDGHPLGLIHRDVSPDNIFLTDDGVVKVTDFGIAKAADRLSQTSAGVLKGKLAYMSPERALDLSFDRRADVFALGIVLWEALAQRRLFRAATHDEVVRRLVDDPIEPPSRYRSSCPPELDAIVLRALAREPNERHQSAHELSVELRQFLRTAAPELDRAALATFIHTQFEAQIAARQARLRAAAATPVEAGAPTEEIVLAPSPTIGLGPTHSAGALLGNTPSRPNPAVEPRTPISFKTLHVSETDISATAARAPSLPDVAQQKRFGARWALAALLAIAAVALIAVPRGSPERRASSLAAEPTPDTASLTLGCDPACSRITLDGRDVTANDAVTLPAGRHSVSYFRDGAEQRVSVTVKPGDTLRLSGAFR